VVLPSNTDPLSDVLAVLGARSVRCTRLEAAGVWGLRFPARQRLKFVALLRGTCWVLPAGHAPQAMAPGDVFLIGAIDYAVASTPTAAVTDGTALYAGQDTARLGGDDTVLLGGGIAFADDHGRFLLGALPTLMKVDRASSSAAAVAGVLELLDREVSSSQLGARLVAAHLAEILLVEALRAYVTDHGGTTGGWLGALGDPGIGDALRAMHAAVDHPWTVGELAKCAGMSRSAFAPRFKERVGRPPLEYLAHWRLTLARRLLAGGRTTLAEVSAQVGYASPSAFGAAFRRAFGHSPRQ
jgi:AraC-like DNA-binding protein